MEKIMAVSKEECGMSILDVLTKGDCPFSKSKSEARRMLESNSVDCYSYHYSDDDTKTWRTVKNNEFIFDGDIIKYGKNDFRKIIFDNELKASWVITESENETILKLKIEKEKR